MPTEDYLCVKINLFPTYPSIFARKCKIKFFKNFMRFRKNFFLRKPLQVCKGLLFYATNSPHRHHRPTAPLRLSTGLRPPFRQSVCLRTHDMPVGVILLPVGTLSARKGSNPPASKKKSVKTEISSHLCGIFICKRSGKPNFLADLSPIGG